ncbi:MAG: aminotransferase class V-fold PLP-dependent enzyme [Planctomycetes bacterium]|nr:aminotransferase class V-fold PLP-dependent enzyme [Planctomycetota bacterium]
MQNGEKWLDFRDQMPVVQEWAYLDHAAMAPLSGPAREALREWCDDATENGDVNWQKWRRRIEETRSAAASMIGADTDEIAFIRNTTEGVTLIAEGLPWQPGDNVVSPAGEFPTNYYPWYNLKSRGVELRLVPAEDGRVSLDQLEAACDDRTRIITVSWVGYTAGWRHDLDRLAEIAHARGALLFVDAIQGLGVCPIDVRRTPVDFLAADGHKWMLGPEGAGLLYIRREHLDRLRPLGVGWNSVRHAGDFTNLQFDLKPSAGRYEGGSYNMGGLLALGASLKLLLQYGLENIFRRVMQLTDLLCEKLQSCGAVVVSDRSEAHRSGIVAFELPGQDPLEVRRICRRAGVVLNCRAGRLRVSPHAYNNEEDIDRLIAALTV